ncbi:MAG: putative toxin-antitoxin system toxin component, PIN family [Thermodesulfobacteriota bacterium]
MVFDSNIYISALVISGGQAERALFRILDGTDTLLISKTILDEVLATLARKFSRDPEALSQTAVMLTEMAEVVKPEHTVRVFKDDPDNRVLECAEAGRADCIVTGDKTMLRLKRYQGIRLISLREYLTSGQ